MNTTPPTSNAAETLAPLATDAGDAWAPAAVAVEIALDLTADVAALRAQVTALTEEVAALRWHLTAGPLAAVAREAVWRDRATKHWQDHYARKAPAGA